jgi:NAD(P)-dependent dehydrogenase (short-subunit alcohol dehydrogenase family)
MYAAIVNFLSMISINQGILLLQIGAYIRAKGCGNPGRESNLFVSHLGNLPTKEMACTQRADETSSYGARTLLKAGASSQASRGKERRYEACFAVGIIVRWRCFIYQNAISVPNALRGLGFGAFSNRLGKEMDKEKILDKLKGKIAVITGGNSGIGLATAEQFVAEGAYVYIIGRRQKELDAAVARIGRNVTSVQGDVTNLADLDRLYAQIAKEKGRVDVVFANAGIAKMAPLGSITEEQFDLIFNINVRGLLFTVQKALPLMHDGGSIILNSAVASGSGPAGMSVYSATKAAVRSFARGWTSDLKDRKIRVNVLSPGYTQTPIFETVGLTQEQIDGYLAAAIPTIPLGRMGQAEESAKAALFLASDDSSYVAGIELFVDGGLASV